MILVGKTEGHNHW